MVYNERGRTGRINFVYKMHNLKRSILFLLSILLVIYQTQSAQILFVFIDFLNFVALILVYLCTNPNNRSIDKIACVK